MMFIRADNAIEYKDLLLKKRFIPSPLNHHSSKYLFFIHPTGYIYIYKRGIKKSFNL